MKSRGSSILSLWQVGLTQYGWGMVLAWQRPWQKEGHSRRRNENLATCSMSTMCLMSTRSNNLEFPRAVILNVWGKGCPDKILRQSVVKCKHCPCVDTFYWFISPAGAFLAVLWIFIIGRCIFWHRGLIPLRVKCHSMAQNTCFDILRPRTRTRWTIIHLISDWSLCQLFHFPLSPAFRFFTQHNATRVTLQNQIKTNTTYAKIIIWRSLPMSSGHLFLLSCFQIWHGDPYN